jgi:hypothetical protein
MFDWLKKALSEGAPEYEPSTSRLLSAICTLASIAWITVLVHHSYALPDVATLGGLTAFNTAPYAANKFAGMIEK